MDGGFKRLPDRGKCNSSGLNIQTNEGNGMTYKWKTGWAGRRVPAQVAGERLEEIRKRGKLTPQAVLADAKSEKSPLHPCFEWDNGVAAEKYRLEQAGQLLRSIEVVYQVPKGRKLPVRAFVNVRKEGERQYTSIQAAVRHVGMREQLLAEALLEIRAWQRKYDALKELSGVFAALAQPLKKLEKKIVAGQKGAARKASA
jgi:hypothetical protein